MKSNRSYLLNNLQGLLPSRAKVKRSENLVLSNKPGGLCYFNRPVTHSIIPARCWQEPYLTLNRVPIIDLWNNA